MLLWFRFKNFGPFRDEAFFDMRPVKAYKELPDHVMHSGSESAVRTAAVYGANASGKSNFIQALDAYSDIYRHSMDHVDPEGVTPLAKYYRPYRFCEQKEQGPTELDAEISVYRETYQYGFSYDDKRIHYEWFYRKSKTGKQMMIFERKGNLVEFGDTVNREECEKYLSGLLDHVLLLSLFDRLQLSDPWWSYAKSAISGIFVSNVSGWYHWSAADSRLIARHLKTPQDKAWFMQHVRAIDVNICDFEIRRGADEEDIRIFTVHKDESGHRYRMPLERESQGTLKAIDLILLVARSTHQDCTWVLDEMNTHLHPLLVKYFVDLFYANNNQAQLIFATHDTMLLDRRYMRRDQVWFVEKDRNNRASLYSLADFKVRNDAALGDRYLAGQYGAIPLLGEWEDA